LAVFDAEKRRFLHHSGPICDHFFRFHRFGFNKWGMTSAVIPLKIVLRKIPARQGARLPRDASLVKVVTLMREFEVF